MPEEEEKKLKSHLEVENYYQDVNRTFATEQKFSGQRQRRNKTMAKKE